MLAYEAGALPAAPISPFTSGLDYGPSAGRQCFSRITMRFRVENGRASTRRRTAIHLEHLEGRELLSTIPSQPVTVQPPPGTTPPITVVVPPGSGNTLPPDRVPPGTPPGPPL